ncbi:hypothetical protein NE237_020627 [Protea cynaroides]|uniref:Strictosidine synthase conserved region domain-containing protein n=1 Tax=Protea cynaroides TaxID=273540 RepID=A0A9Q0HAX7_9MAGN|nr:hypothetical protein NE237_020627 [Protea cynaroides]
MHMLPGSNTAPCHSSYAAAAMGNHMLQLAPAAHHRQAMAASSSRPARPQGLRKCSKYDIQGERLGSIETFIDNLPGFPDNIRYNGEGCFWIGIATGKTVFWDALMRYPIMWKTVWMLEKVVRLPNMQRHGGVMAVNLEGKAIAFYSEAGLTMVSNGNDGVLGCTDEISYMRKTVWMLEKMVRFPNTQSHGEVMAINLEGEAIALYSEPGLSMVSNGIKIGNHLYIGYIANICITSLHLNQQT